MGFRFSRRVGSNNGFGFNVSGSGVSPSYRTKMGSVSSRGFSIRTGIPGLSFRSGWGGGRSKGNTGLIILLFLVGLYLAFNALVVIYNILRFLGYALGELYRFLARAYLHRQERKRAKQTEQGV